MENFLASSPWLVASTAIAVSMALTFALALRLRDNSIVDIAYGLIFVIVSAVTFAGSPTRHPREILLLVLVGLWGIRLAAHLALRKRNEAEDFRYRAWRESWGRWFLLRSVLQIYVLQGAVILVVLTPVLLVRRDPGGALGGLDFAGIGLWGLGFLFEAIGDGQLLAWKRDPKNRGRFIRHGLWRWTRHPNYFGEATLWWGIFLIGLGAGGGTVGIVSPVTIGTLLLFVSGIPMLERKWAGNPEFEAYQRATSPFFPWFPKAEKRLAGDRDPLSGTRSPKIGRCAITPPLRSTSSCRSASSKDLQPVCMWDATFPTHSEIGPLHPAVDRQPARFHILAVVEFFEWRLETRGREPDPPGRSAGSRWPTREPRTTCASLPRSRNASG